MRQQTTTAALQTPASAEMPPVRLHFLDGVRGIAAFYVVLYHAVQEIHNFTPHLHSPIVNMTYAALGYGHLAVGVFIVLSGFCLMLPVARSRDSQLRGGFKGYILRRMQRILPPYYAALVLSLLAIRLLSGMPAAQNTTLKLAASAWTPGSLGSHLLLLHNLHSRWVYSIDPPMWSVATEWQIYFVFPLLLLPAHRRWGNAGALAVGIGLALIFAFTLHRFGQACFWYIALFAFGMTAATRLGKSSPQETRLAGFLAPALGVIAIGLAQGNRPSLTTWGWRIDFIAGGSAAALLVHLAGCAYHRPNGLLRICESRPALGLGAFSYSLYLIHFPVLSSLHVLANARHFSPEQALALEMTAGTALSFALSYLFYLAFEKPFVRAAVKAKNAASESEKVPT